MSFPAERSEGKGIQIPFPQTSFQSLLAGDDKGSRHHAQNAAPGADDGDKKANGYKGQCVFKIGFQHVYNPLVCLLEGEYVPFLFFCQMLL